MWILIQLVTKEGEPEAYTATNLSNVQGPSPQTLEMGKKVLVKNITSQETKLGRILRLHESKSFIDEELHQLRLIAATKLKYKNIMIEIERKMPKRILKRSQYSHSLDSPSASSLPPPMLYPNTVNNYSPNTTVDQSTQTERNESSDLITFTQQEFNKFQNEMKMNILQIAGRMNHLQNIIYNNKANIFNKSRKDVSTSVDLSKTPSDEYITHDADHKKDNITHNADHKRINNPCRRRSTSAFEPVPLSNKRKSYLNDEFTHLIKRRHSTNTNISIENKTNLFQILPAATQKIGYRRYSNIENAHNQNRSELNKTSLENETFNKNMVQIGSSGKTFVSLQVMKNIQWSSYSHATRVLLSTLFDTCTLSTHTLSAGGKKRFQNGIELPKKSLDATTVKDLVETVTKYCGVEEKLVRSAISIKCYRSWRSCASKRHNSRNKKSETPKVIATAKRI